jgi:O-antigen/teichoic acid export membrane protein
MTGIPVPWVINVILLRGPGGLVDVAYLNVARQLIQAATFVPEVISQVTLPRLTNAFAKGLVVEFCHTVRTGMAIQVAFVIATGVGFLAFGGIIGDIFRLNAEQLLMLLLLVVAQALLTVLCMPYGAILWATGDVRKAFLFALLRAIVSLGAVWVLRDHGAIGVLTALCATLAGQFFLVVLPQSYTYLLHGSLPAKNSWPMSRAANAES